MDLRILSSPGYLLTVSTYSVHSWELNGVRNWLPAVLASTAATAGTSNPAATAGLVATGTTSSGTPSLLLGCLQWPPHWSLTGVVFGYGIVITVDGHLPDRLNSGDEYPSSRIAGNVRNVANREPTPVLREIELTQTSRAPSTASFNRSRST